MLSVVLVIMCASVPDVCPPICPSVTLWHCIKTNKAIGHKNLTTFSLFDTVHECDRQTDRHLH